MPPRLRTRFLLSLLGLALWFSSVALADVEIVLRNDFIEKYKNRATIDSSYFVDKAHARPNAPSKDGDLHIAGRSPDIELPTVAEIMNAKEESEAVDLVHDAEGTGTPIGVAGVWRIWCEHGGNSTQRQGEPLEPFKTTNPDHVFEIHPVTVLSGRSILGSFHPIQGFEEKDAKDAFTVYENVRSEIIPGDDATTIITGMAGYNYVKFRMELREAPSQIVDGLHAFAKVEETNGELIVQKRRMIFVNGTAPANAVKNLGEGDTLTVLGIPRIDLSLVSWRASHRQGLTWNVPYEIVVVGVYRR